MSPQDVLTTADFARILRCTASTLNKMCERGELPQPFMVGKRRRWLRATVDAWIAARGVAL